MKDEAAIRQLIAILEAFNGPRADGRNKHTKEIIALKWVLDEYPPKDGEKPHE